jgi:hypothetical protein
MPKLYTELPLSGSIKIEIPKKVLKATSDDKVVLFNTFTKAKNIAGGRSRAVELLPVNDNKVKVISEGTLKKADKKSREELANQIKTGMKKINEQVNEKKTPKKAPSSTSGMKMRRKRII